jgi:hypothetical protein
MVRFQFCLRSTKYGMTHLRFRKMGESGWHQIFKIQSPVFGDLASEGLLLPSWKAETPRK